MSRVHDALRRAEMGGMMPPEEPPEVPDEVAQVSPDLRPPDFGTNGAASAASVGPTTLATAHKHDRNRQTRRAGENP